MLTGEAILNGLPVPTLVVRPASLYQVRVLPLPPVALSEMLPESVVQKLLRSTAAEVGAVAA